MSNALSRRQFMSRAATVTGLVGLHAALPKGLLALTHAGSTGQCRLGGNDSLILNVEPLIDRTLSVHRVYKAWGEEVFTPDVVDSAVEGRFLVISIFPVTRSRVTRRWSAIAAGKHDRAIRDLATQLKGFAVRHPGRIGLAFNHEPENDRDSSDGSHNFGEAADFRSAWRHFFGKLSDAGVDNIHRTLILMGSSYKNGLADRFWPGASHVDRLGVDCYNWFGSVQRSGSRWRSFREIARGANDYALRKGRKLWVCETGTLEDPADPDRKARWIADMGSTLKTMPNIKAVMYFEGAKNGWWMARPPQGSTDALEAFRALANDPYFL